MGTKDIKLMLAAIVITFGFITLLAFWQGKADVYSGDVAEVEVSPLSYDLGNVPIGGGIVTRKYEIKNTSNETLRIKKITTSCMCTEAKIVAGGKETRFYGMEGHGRVIPNVNFDIAGGETAKVIVNFDPAAHGPEGVGPFERVVWMAVSDPAGIKELWFEGTVVN